MKDFEFFAVNFEHYFCSFLRKSYRLGIQIHGYALVSTCLNHQKQHEIFHVLSKVGLDRLLQQENALGGYYNDWYHYGKGY